MHLAALVLFTTTATAQSGTASFDWNNYSTALTEYIFAANGNYKFIGVGGSTVTRADANYDYIYIKTSSFAGDGSYSIRNNQLVFKRRGDRNAEQVPFRFDKVNHGGTGWKDRLYMRKVSAGDGKQYEVCYEKLK